MLRDSYPVPIGDPNIFSSADVIMFSTPDAHLSYCQVEMEDIDREKAALKSDHRLRQFILPFFG